MPHRWIDTTRLSFNTLLLLEKVQLSWMPLWFPKKELGTALTGHPHVVWFIRHKCPEISSWLDQLLAEAVPPQNEDELRQAEITVLRSMADLDVYALDPSLYDAQPFLTWDDRELTSLVDFSGKTVLDIGAGTGRLAFVAARTAQLVYAVEPVGNLRDYMRQKAERFGFNNFYAVDGIITAIPFPDQSVDIVLGGHVYGDLPAEELAEMERVVRKGGYVILCPGNSDLDSSAHQYLVSQGYQWGCFEEPTNGLKRKYWKQID